MWESNRKGRILRIERASLHDGNGLRTVVFLKGCPLRCLWCSTPESQHMGYELGFRAGQCVGCGKCAAACPSGALGMEKGKPIRKASECTLCFSCEKACTNAAWQIYGSDMSPEELVKQIAKDEIFYFHSGGGVTFSGGEPLMQADFVAEVMKHCRLRGIHTAIETSLYAPWKEVTKAAEYLDWMFVDLKVMDTKRHMAATGVENGLILENLRRLDAERGDLPVHVRIPVIPGINNDRENLEQTVRFCDSLKIIKDIELLPYHRLGLETYRNLNLKYCLEDTASPTPEEMTALADYMNQISERVPVHIGG